MEKVGGDSKVDAQTPWCAGVVAVPKKKFGLHMRGFTAPKQVCLEGGTFPSQGGSYLISAGRSKFFFQTQRQLWILADPPRRRI